ncbi:unnamed protein product [Mesocestoides corti]|uniref:Scavenger receptor class B member 1 n=2 Tax=Mesocestoides corti TaxID=53468 RepID=A0A0R3UBN7_MESCO|nr:unnamed protein product [Mesocestoides corti]
MPSNHLSVAIGWKTFDGLAVVDWTSDDRGYDSPLVADQPIIGRQHQQQPMKEWGESLTSDQPVSEFRRPKSLVRRWTVKPDQHRKITLLGGESHQHDEMSFCRFSKRSAIVTGVLTTIVLLIALVLLILIGVFDILVDNMIAKSVAITPSSSVCENWVAPDTPIFFSIYLFNITNHHDILRGEKPRIQQIGPYVYR